MNVRLNTRVFRSTLLHTGVEFMTSVHILITLEFAGARVVECASPHKSVQEHITTYSGVEFMTSVHIPITLDFCRKH